MAYGVATSTDTPNPDPGEEYTPRAPEEWPDVVAQPVPVTPSNDDTFAGPVQTPEQVLGSGGPVPRPPRARQGDRPDCARHRARHGADRT